MKTQNVMRYKWNKENILYNFMRCGNHASQGLRLAWKWNDLLTLMLRDKEPSIPWTLVSLNWALSHGNLDFVLAGQLFAFMGPTYWGPRYLSTSNQCGRLCLTDSEVIVPFIPHPPPFPLLSFDSNTPIPSIGIHMNHIAVPSVSFMRQFRWRCNLIGVPAPQKTGAQERIELELLWHCELKLQLHSRT